MKSKNFATVNQKICVSCGSCELVCPMQAIRVIRGCYAEVNTEKCVGCGKCAKICPADCISIQVRNEVAT